MSTILLVSVSLAICTCTVPTFTSIINIEPAQKAESFVDVYNNVHFLKLRTQVKVMYNQLHHRNFWVEGLIYPYVYPFEGHRSTHFPEMDAAALLILYKLKRTPKWSMTYLFHQHSRCN